LAGDLNQRFAGAVPYLRAFARILGGHLHLTAALADSTAGKREKLARFYIKRLMPEYIGLLSHAQSGAEDLYAISVEEMAS
jgi:acyl-CoA dehydrogenase